MDYNHNHQENQIVKKKTGRPLGTAVQTHQLQTRVSAEFLDKLDEWRRFEPDLPSRTEAIRRIVEKFLTDPSNQRKPRR